jgi:hypothetical protein
MTIYNGIDFQMWFKIFLLLYSSAWSFSTNLLSRLSMCYIQRQPSLPAHENRQVTAISYSLALFLLVIHTLLHYFRIIDKRNLSRWSASSLVLKHNYTAAKQSSYWRSKVTVFFKYFPTTVLYSTIELVTSVYTHIFFAFYHLHSNPNWHNST